MRTFIIAEAGVNHNGDMSLAKKLIDVAHEAGADAVKFQSFKTEKLVTKSAKKADYQIANTSGDQSDQFSMLKKLELSEVQHLELMDYCKTVGIQFMSTPFDFESADFLNQHKVNPLKISSGDLINIPFLRKVAKFQKKIILSTGMAELEEIKLALRTLVEAGLDKRNVAILHCNTEYPTPFCDVNLLAMVKMGEELEVEIGYSDHTCGIEVPSAAVALGAKIIEKHFTLDKNMEGPDHLASLDPVELKQMVSAIRNIEKALGHSKKTASPSEMKNILLVRKSIVANIPIKKGEVFSETNLALKRPGDGISSIQWDQVIGKVAEKNFEIDEQIVL